MPLSHKNKAPQSAPQSICVHAPCRLHFGFLSWGEKSRHFGSLGMTLAQSCIRVTARRHTHDDLDDDIAAVVALYQQHMRVPSLHMRCQHDNVVHQGLGSGTQWHLAVGMACAIMAGEKTSPRHIMLLANRGKRSGIGLAAFEGGGVLLDGGVHPDRQSPPPLLCRHDFPDQWRVLLIQDYHHAGVFGTEEKSAFDNLSASTPHQSANLCKVIMLETLPALLERDFITFSRGVRLLQTAMIDAFASSQGGSYRSPEVAKALTWLAKNGVIGLGQSSWGPSGFALFADEKKAQDMKKQLQKNHPTLMMRVVRGQNHGATITTEDHNYGE